MSIKAKLSTIILFIGAILFLITGFMVWSNISARDQNLFSQGILDSLRAGTKVENGLIHFNNSLEQYFLTGQSKILTQIQAEEEEIEAAFLYWRRALQVLISLDVGFDAGDRDRLEGIERNFTGIKERKNEALEWFQQGHTDNSRTAYGIDVKTPTSALIAKVIRSMQEIKLKVGTAYSANFARSSSPWIRGLLVLAVFSFVILFISYRMLSNIHLSLDRLKEGVRSFGAGDLDNRIQITNRDELGKLGRSFNEMAENLQKTTISRDYVDSILRSMIGSLFVLDGEGRIQTVNQAGETLLGYKKEDLSGKSIADIFDPSSAFSTRPLGELERLPDQFQKEDALRTSCGRTIPILLTASVMTRDESGFKKYVLGALDITERKEAELKLAALVEDLDRANHELKDFAYIVSHDLKAPLRAINSLASWLEMDYGESLDDEGCEQLHLLTGRVKRMQALIDGILQYSRVGRSNDEMEEIDLNDLVSDVIDSLAPPAHILVDLEGNLPHVHGERIRLQQVFQNLIGNAIKYMDKDQGFVKIGCREDNGNWQFYISDNGPGIKKDTMRKSSRFSRH